MTNLDELRKKAEAAPPGPWEESNDDGYSSWRIHGGRKAILQVFGEGPCADSNAEFIAAANPAVVLELIAEIERLREEAAGWV